MSGGDPVAAARATLEEIRHGQATQLWQEGLEQSFLGNSGKAIQLYQKSIAIHPTAEAYNLLGGWTLSHMGELEQAILMCREAIKTDPDFGNAYNDIGSYLEVQGRRDEAITWFRRAKDASRYYDSPHFPYLNLARIYIRREEWGAALLELQTAEILAPHDPCVDMLITRVAEHLT